MYASFAKIVQVWQAKTSAALVSSEPATIFIVVFVGTRSNNSSYSPEQHGGKLKNLSFWKRSRKDKMTGCVLASLTPSVYNIYARI